MKKRRQGHKSGRHKSKLEFIITMICFLLLGWFDSLHCSYSFDGVMSYVMYIFLLDHLS